VRASESGSTPDPARTQGISDERTADTTCAPCDQTGTLLEIAGKPLWFIVLFFIPGVNFIALLLVAIGVANAFGKSTGFGLGLAFLGPIFYPLLAFGDATCQGNAAPGARTAIA